MQLSGFAIGQYYPGDSLLHRVDPRTKITAALIYVVALFFAGGFAGLAVMGAGLALALAAARVPPFWLYRGVRPVLLLLAITFLFQLFLHGGEEMSRIGPLVLYRQGAAEGGFLALRLLLLVLSSTMLSFTTPPVLLTDALGKMMAPLKKLRFPAFELALMMTIALRFIPTLLMETDRIIKAQMARGARVNRGGLFSRARGFMPVLIPLFILSFRNADELAQAMEARCYRGGRGRTSRRKLRLGWRDGVFALLFGALVAAGIGAGRYL